MGSGDALVQLVGIESQRTRLDAASAANAVVQLLLPVNMECQNRTGICANRGVFRVGHADAVHGTALDEIGRLPQQAAALQNLCDRGADGDLQIAGRGHAVSGNGHKGGGLHSALGDRTVQVQQSGRADNQGVIPQRAEGANFHRVAALHAAHGNSLDGSGNFGVEGRHIFIYGDEALVGLQGVSDPG